MNDDLLIKAIDLIKAGDKKGGGKILYGIVKEDPNNETALLWLSACFRENKKKRYLFLSIEIEPTLT